MSGQELTSHAVVPFRSLLSREEDVSLGRDLGCRFLANGGALHSGTKRVLSAPAGTISSAGGIIDILKGSVPPPTNKVYAFATNAGPRRAVP